MIAVIGGTKGDSGKTLLATNLTVMRAEQCRDVLLIDADEQASATLFTRQRRQDERGNVRSVWALDLHGAAAPNWHSG